MSNGEIKFSPSTLNLFLECPRCFWLKYCRGIIRPKGLVPSLCSGMDKEIKEYFDKFRGTLPPELAGKVDGKLIDDMDLLRKWRSTRQPALIYYPEPNIRVAGALDDCLIKDVDNLRYYKPIDFKSRGYNLKEAVPAYYQNQMDCYHLLMEKCGFSPVKGAYLIYYVLKNIQSSGLARFDVQVVPVETSAQRAEATITRAIETIQGSIPEASPNCEYCKYRESVFKMKSSA